MTAKISQKSENQFIFGEHDGTDRRLRQVKTKIFDSERRERIIRVFFRNLTFFGRRAPTNMECAHTPGCSQVSVSWVLWNDERAPRDLYCFGERTPNTVDDLMIKLENVYLFEKRVNLSARSYSTSFVNYKTKLACAHSPTMTWIDVSRSSSCGREKPRQWELKRTLFDPSTFVDGWERVESWIATRFQNNFASRKRFKPQSEIRPHKLKQNHQSKLAPKQKSVMFFAGTSI